MDDIRLINEAYDELAASRMTTKQDIGTLILYRDHELILRRNKGEIEIKNGRIINLPGRRSIQFILDGKGCLIRFEDSSGDLINAQYVLFPPDDLAKAYRVSILNDLDGPILDLR